MHYFWSIDLDRGCLVRDDSVQQLMAVRMRKNAFSFLFSLLCYYFLQSDAIVNDWV